jgi:hypothetical protein
VPLACLPGRRSVVVPLCFHRVRDRGRLQLTLVNSRPAGGFSVTGICRCLPLLVQVPFLSVTYLLFRSTTVDGRPNGLLSHHLFGAPLGSHWLGGPGPLSAQGMVFVVTAAPPAAIRSGRLAAGSVLPPAGTWRTSSPPPGHPLTGGRIGAVTQRGIHRRGKRETVGAACVLGWAHDTCAGGSAHRQRQP